MKLRKLLLRVVKWLLSLHYKIKITGEELLQDGATHLVLPNHSAYIDPILLFSYLWWLPLRPMTDEKFYHHWLYGKILKLAHAIDVPNMTKSVMSREERVKLASKLSQAAINNLKNGNEICFYPSGHVKLIDREVIGNRRLAYDVCREVPYGVKIILCRMCGLEESVWSKLKPKSWAWRRKVTLCFEDHTEELKELAKKLTRREFNQHLEDWYNKELPKD